ncbi:MAG: PAS domain S-box protein, partial [Sphingobacteriales bacterium]
MLILWGPAYFCFYNDAYRLILGKEDQIDCAVGKSAAQAWPDSWRINQSNYEAVTTTGEASWYENRLLPLYRNGQLENVYWTYSTSPIQNELGTTEGLLVVCTETTHTVTSQKKREQNEEWLQMALDAAEMGTWDLNLSTNTIQASELTKALFGLPPHQEADLMQAFNNVKEQDRSRVVEAIKQAIYHGAKYNIDYTVVMQNGTERMVNSRGKLYYSVTGMPNRFAGIVQDITKDVAAHRQQQQLASLVENSSDAMAISNLEGQLMYINQSFKNLIGIAADAPVHQFTTKDFYTESGYENLIQRLRPVVDSTGKWAGTANMKHLVSGETIACQIDANQIIDPFTGKMVA